MSILFIGSIGFVIAVAVAATTGVLRDSSLDPGQRALQVLLIWLIPVLGALATFLVRRSQTTSARSGETVSTNDFGQAIDMQLSQSNDAESDPGHGP